jgi:hypothetical protein
MKATLETITPAIAAEMLEKNTSNRPVRLAVVKQYAKEMEMGRWKVNGDTIRFNGETMLDGQHRCMASIMSGCTFQTLVVRGLSDGVFSTIDSGPPRSGGDVLAIQGALNANTLAATLKFVDRIATGKVGYIRMRYTNTEVEELYSKYPNMSASVNMLRNRGKSVCSPSILAGLHYLFALRDQNAANKFVEDVQNGIGLMQGDAVYLLRERLLQNSYMKQKLRPEYIAALGIKSWNARRANKKVSVLKFLDSETFPLIAD